MKFTFAPETRPLDGYTIKRAIHRGGFGEVYYAISDAGKEVALKLLNNNLEVELRGVSQCLNLKHPNLVSIFDIRTDSDGDHWIIMEYVGGKILQEVLRQHPNGMSQKDTIRWMRGIAEGLAFLHDRGIVHRDLKPANVFQDSAAVKIGDIGLSKYISESRRSAHTQSVGTVYYMAPEVAHGRYGREVDIYALGVILYEMITGNVPFDGQTTAEILMKHLTERPDLTKLPAQLQPVLARALEKDPKQRYSDPLVFARDVEAAFQGASPRATARAAQSNRAPHRAAGYAAGAAAAGAAAAAGSAAPSAFSGMSTWDAAKHFWLERVPTPMKWILGGSAAILVVNFSGPMLALLTAGAALGGIAFCTVWLFKAMFGTGQPSQGSPYATQPGYRPPRPQPAAQQPRPAPAQYAAARVAPPPPPRPAPPQRHPQPAPQATPRPVILSPETRRTIGLTQRMGDLSSSLSLAAVATVIITGSVAAFSDLLDAPNQVMLFGMGILIPSWAVISLGKLREGRPVDGMMRRLLMGGVGTGVGAAVYGASQFLMVPLSVAPGQAAISDLGSFSLIQAGQPTLACFMTLFGGLFALRRWWWQSDSFRSSRFRLGSVFVTFLLGTVLGAILPFPIWMAQAWAVAISCVVQLSSGWTPHEDRVLVPVAAKKDVDERKPVSRDVDAKSMAVAL